jgi:uncharacterized delta-60 repeat protein
MTMRLFSWPGKVGRPRRPARGRLGVERLEERVLLNAGDLDLSFGAGGKVTTGFLGPSVDSAQAVVVSQAGKIIVAGTSTGNNSSQEIALARYNADGSLDATFGSGGRVLTSFAPDEQLNGAALQADGKLIVVGTINLPSTGDDFLVARYNADGSLDSTFGNGGEVTTDFGSGDVARGVAIQSDGRIVVVGSSPGAGVSDNYALARYNTDGSLDGTFGAGGKATADFGPTADRAYSVAIQSDGKLVVGGFANMARFNPDGSLDTSFGTGGVVGRGGQGVVLQADGKILVSAGVVLRYNTDGSPDAGFGHSGLASAGILVTSLGVQADGKIVAAGTFNGEMALARLSCDGSLDTTFGTSGRALADFSGPFDQANGVVVQADGTIVAAGLTGVNPLVTLQGPEDFAVARFATTGALDASFGAGGKVATDFPSPANTSAGAMLLQPDGKVVMAGVTSSLYSSTGSDVALARYNSDGSLDPTFGNAGQVVADFGPSDFADSLAVQPDGKLLVAGSVLARFNADGTLDTTFGTAGSIALTDFTAGSIGLNAFTERLTHIALQGDGKIVVTGPGASFSEWLTERFNPDGTLDTGFGNAGKVVTVLGGFEFPSGLVLQADGKIVVAGDTGFSSSVAIVRYNPDGSLDSTFGSGGEVSTDFGTSSSQANCIALQGDGKMIVAGEGGGSFAALRLNGNGALDPTFGTGGKAVFGVSDSTGAPLGSVVQGVALQSTGKIVLAGYAGAGFGMPISIALARLTPSGSLDPFFGTNGEVLTSFSSDDAEASAVAIQPDGNILVGGSANPGQVDFALARYQGVGPEDEIEQAAIDVKALASAGDLNGGQSNALLAKLQAAVGQLSNDHVGPAINQLQAFVNNVNSFVAQGVLTADQAQPLLDAAQNAIDLLDSTPSLPARQAVKQPTAALDGLFLSLGELGLQGW